MKYHSDGNIEYLNRLDNQVKVRGFRIELGEIEAAITNHPAINQAIVGVKYFDHSDQRLICYVTTVKGKEISNKDVREHLRMQLPEYMIPQHVVKMEVFPLTPSGKVDRKSLPRPLDLQDDTAIST